MYEVISDIDDINARAMDGAGRSYNLKGQAVNNSYRGIVIKNGRKVLKR